MRIGLCDVWLKKKLSELEEHRCTLTFQGQTTAANRSEGRNQKQQKNNNNIDGPKFKDSERKKRS